MAVLFAPHGSGEEHRSSQGSFMAGRGWTAFVSLSIAGMLSGLSRFKW